MPGQRQRALQLTRRRISNVATTLFLERGFDHVTVSEVARAAEVSKVTVFAHFPRKEDLLLDRGPEAAELVQRALRDRRAGVSAVDAVFELAVDLARSRHPLSCLDPGTEPFVRLVAASPALLARARELGAELESVIVRELCSQHSSASSAELTAALIVTAYRVALTRTARRILAGRTRTTIVAGHRRDLAAAFDAVRAATAAL